MISIFADALDPTDPLVSFFSVKPPDGYIHIIVQAPAIGEHVVCIGYVILSHHRTCPYCSRQSHLN